MVLVSYSGKEINAKIVYYGPGLSGKTTNLESIFGSIPEGHKGRMVSVKTKTERTLFFDFLPVNLGELSGFKTRFLLYTVPGQVYYNATRKLVLKGVDAVVFVADSQKDKMQENLDSLQNLRENLRDQGMKLEDIPWVLQYNKRDLPDIFPISELDAKLNTQNVPSYTAVATTGEGVLDTFKAVSRALLKHLSKEIGVKVVQGQEEVDQAIESQVKGGQAQTADAATTASADAAKDDAASPAKVGPAAPVSESTPGPEPVAPPEPATEPVAKLQPEITPLPTKVSPELKAEAHEYVTPVHLERPPELKAEVKPEAATPPPEAKAEPESSPSVEVPPEVEAKAEPVTPMPSAAPDFKADEQVTPLPTRVPPETKAEPQVTPLPTQVPPETKAEPQVTPLPTQVPAEIKAESRPEMPEDEEPVQVRTIYPKAASPPTEPPKTKPESAQAAEAIRREAKPAEPADEKPAPLYGKKPAPPYGKKPVPPYGQKPAPTFAQRLKRWFGRMESKTDKEDSGAEKTKSKKEFGARDSTAKPIAQQTQPVAFKAVTPDSQPQKAAPTGAQAGVVAPDQQEPVEEESFEEAPTAEIPQPTFDEPEPEPEPEEELDAEATEPTREISHVVPMPPMGAQRAPQDAGEPEQDELVIPVLLPKRNIHRQLVLKICIRFAEDEDLYAPEADIDGDQRRAVDSA